MQCGAANWPFGERN